MKIIIVEIFDFTFCKNRVVFLVLANLVTCESIVHPCVEVSIESKALLEVVFGRKRTSSSSH